MMDQGEIPRGGQQRKKHDEIHNRLYAFFHFVTPESFPLFYRGNLNNFLISDFQSVTR
ncbi:hypothetical protein KOSB73_260471 [Klebsiella grimontii]|uniref:Uncharacterized protein n=1 Tax=Klebsiella grimontii TaxID=2058152 RepID=A0A285B477_9ENTR|nr:hypothetical protein KOSB73_260471 [Klebsiella grimontii]